MKNMLSSTSVTGLVAATGALLLAPLACATPGAYDITINTAPLIGQASGPFSLDFQLNDGSGSADANNTANIGGFFYFGGSATGGATLSGGASGDLVSGVQLTETSAFNELYQGFTPGSTLTFHVSLTLNADAGVTPDVFTFGILDSSLFNIPTTASDNSLFTITINGASPTFATASGTDIPVTVTAVPEPGFWAVAAGGLLLAFGTWRRVRR